MSKEGELGMLIIVILKARNLNDKHSFRKQDAFAKVSLNGTEKKTKVEIKGGQHPVWDEEVRIPIMKDTGAKFRKLEVSCWAKEPRSDDLLGAGTIDISETLKTGEFDDWVPLSIDGVTRGDVYLEMTYYAHGPAPPSLHNGGGGSLAVPQASNLMRRPSKFSHEERLSRPTVSTTSLRPGQNSIGGSAYQGNPYGSPVTGRNKKSNLPALPEDRPPQSSSAAPQSVPNLLRPGAAPAQGQRPYSDPVLSSSPPRQSYGYYNGASSSPPSASNPYLTPSQRPQSSFPPSQPLAQQPHYAPSPSPQSNPYLATSPAPNHAYNPPHNQGPGGPPLYRVASPTSPISQTPIQTHIPSFSHTPVPSGPPPIWTAPASQPLPPGGGFAFPLPTISTTPAQINPYPATMYNSPQARVSSSSYRHQRLPSDPREDPKLMARYQTPLPLPPGARASSSAPSSPPHTQPYPQQAPYKPPSPVQLPPPPPKESLPGRGTTPDPQRIEALRRAEQDAARRREQELKDLELAMQLDQELNRG